jgi:hypothetical protein
MFYFIGTGKQVRSRHNHHITEGFITANEGVQGARFPPALGDAFTMAR